MRLDDPESSFVGSLLGLALGDALGARFEGGLVERSLWRFIGTTRDGKRRWTDDTQMALDLAESLISCGSVDQDEIARRFARSYRWSRGYGPGAARLLKLMGRGVDWRTANTRVFREGSFGNGGAMRAPVVGLFYAHSHDRLVAHARATAVITHAHPLGQEGAVVVALATALALQHRSPTETLEVLLGHAEQAPVRERLETARSWLARGTPSADEVGKRLGNGNAASESCVTAIYIGLRFLERSFPEMLDFVAACRGDVDTIGAMAGAIWGARNGAAALPADDLAKLEDAERVREVARALYRASSALSPPRR